MIRKFTNLLKSNPPPSDNRQPSSLELKVESAETVTAKKNWPQALRSWQAVLDEFGKSPQTPEETLRHIRFNISLLKRLVDMKSYKAKIKAHGSKPRPGPGRIAIYTSFTKGYDNLLPPEVIDERFDYVVFTDHQPDGFGLFDVRPLPEPNHDNARAIRYPKTHAHLLFKSYDAAVWVDTSFMIIGDLWPVIKAYMASGRPIGSSDHPYRKTLHQEFEACVARSKDDYKALKEQIDFYDHVGFGLEPEITARLSRYKIDGRHLKFGIMATTYQARTMEQGKKMHAFRDGIKALKEILWFNLGPL